MGIAPHMASTLSLIGILQEAARLCILMTSHHMGSLMRLVDLADCQMTDTAALCSKAGTQSTAPGSKHTV